MIKPHPQLPIFQLNFYNFKIAWRLFILNSKLPKLVGQQSNFHGRADSLVENVINSLRDRHMNFIPLIDFMNSLHAKVSLGNHQHLHLRGLHGIPFPDHRPERPVPAELGIGRYQQISQVRGKLNIPLHRMNGIHKTLHFLNSISNQHGLEIIAIPQSVTDS